MNQSLDVLRNVDPGLLKLDCGDGKILVSNHLQGRIFAAFGGELIHRFVRELAEKPDPVEFNNIGGNSLWPAPEGGDFAYNYPPEGAWRVQDGINRVPTHTVAADAESISIEKEINLENRRGKRVKLRFARTVKPLETVALPGEEYGLERTGYRTVDELRPLEKYSSSEVLLSAWSLEQFPGAAGISAFGRCFGSAENCANDDFYGSAASRLGYCGEMFRFELGGEKRLQIGVKAASRPALIGALDRERGILVVRTTPPRSDGKYINMADNDQKSGPYGAADMFSIFNGADELNFHELETIAPMEIAADGTLLGSTLQSTTFLLKGELAALECCLAEFFGVRL